MTAFSLSRAALLASLMATSGGAPLSAQRFPSHDPRLRQIWDEGINKPRLREVAHVLMDSIGPRLTGSPADLAGHDWLVARYKALDITAFNETYSTDARRWRRGATHVDLTA